MSLINDALKQAKQAQKSNPPPTHELPFRPAESSPPRSSGSPLMILAIVIIVMLAGLLAVLALQRRDAGQPTVQARQAAAPLPQTSTLAATASVVNPVPVERTVSAPKPATAVAPAEISASVATSTNASASTDTTTNAVVAAIDPVPVKAAAPKLQGIFYRPARPSAVISGKTVFVGNRVGEFQVLAITQESVTITSGTQTNVLKLGE